MITLILLIFSFSLSYGLLLFSIDKVPEKFWDESIDFFSNLLTILRQRKNALPLIGEIYRGEKLLLAFSECEARVSLGIKILSDFLPQYKFYTDLLERLFESHRLQGIGIKKFIPEIRQALIQDLQFEKKILDEIISGLLQFMVIAATTWSFVFLSKSLVEIPLDNETLAFMVAFQTIGTILFFQLVGQLKTKSFAPFYKAIEELYLFSSLMEVGLPINEVLERSEIMSGSLITHKNFHNLSNRLKKLVSRMKDIGLSPKDEAQEIIREIWHLQQAHFLKFTKIVQVLKFSILAFFFLPAYFVYLYAIFKFFMEQ